MQAISEMKLWEFAKICMNLQKLQELAKKYISVDTIQKVLGMFKFPFYYFKHATFESQTIYKIKNIDLLQLLHE